MAQLPDDLIKLGARPVEIPDDLKALGARAVDAPNPDIPQEEIHLKPNQFRFTAPTAPEPPKPFLDRIGDKLPYDPILGMVPAGLMHLASGLWNFNPGPNTLPQTPGLAHIPFVEEGANWLANQLPQWTDPRAQIPAMGLRMLGGFIANPAIIPGKAPIPPPGPLELPPAGRFSPGVSNPTRVIAQDLPQTVPFRGGPSGASGQVVPTNLPENIQPWVDARIAGMGEGRPATSGLGTAADLDWIQEQRRIANLDYTAAEHYPGTRLNIPDKPVESPMGITGETRPGRNPELGYSFDALPNQLRPRVNQVVERATAGNQAEAPVSGGDKIKFVSGPPEGAPVPEPVKPEFNVGQQSAWEPAPKLRKGQKPPEDWVRMPDGTYQRPIEPEQPSARKFNVTPANLPMEMPPAESIFTKAGKVAPRTQFQFTRAGATEQEIAQDKLKAAMTPEEEASGLFSRWWNLPRSVKASWDMSAPLRQGKGLILNKSWWTSWDDMVKAFGSEKAYQSIQNSILSDDMYDLARRGKLAITDLGKAISNREEAFASDLAEHIPLVRRSNRAYNAFLNKARFDAFKSMVNDYEAAGINIRNDDTLLQKVADQINTASGRGSLKFGNLDLEKSTDLMTNVFFAPKLISSRLKIMASPVTYFNADKIQRVQALKTLLGLTGASITELGLAKMAGASIGLDPTSADFWKAKFGNVRLDPNSGFEPYFTLAAREITGQRTSSRTGLAYELGSKYGLPDRLSTLGEFVMNKTNPNVEFALSLAQAMHGNTLKPSSLSFGDKQRPFNLGMNPFENEAVRLVTPMIISDLYDVYKENPGLLPVTVPYGFFGGGVQAYK